MRDPSIEAPRLRGPSGRLTSVRAQPLQVLPQPPVQGGGWRLGGRLEVTSCGGGARFYEALTVKDRARCDYHDANWDEIAWCSALVLAIGPDEAGDWIEPCLVVARDERLRRRHEGWLYSLFADPIQWHAGLIHVLNGQHRVCVRTSGRGEGVRGLHQLSSGAWRRTILRARSEETP